MEIQSIRNATMRIHYAGHSFVCDPYLADKFSRPTYSGKSLNPMVDLPCKPQEVIAEAEFFLLSHLHSDHFDPAAADLIDKDALMFCQPGDAVSLASKGFNQIIPVETSVSWKDISIERVPGQHGSGKVLDEMGQVSGYIISAANEPSIYWVGDSILTDTIRDTITRVDPAIILTHSCGAVWGEDHRLILMDAEQTIEVCCLAPNSKVIAIHMGAVDHATVTREELRDYATMFDIKDQQLFIPNDGEELQFI